VYEMQDTACIAIKLHTRCLQNI